MQTDRYLIGGTAGGHAGQEGDGRDGEVGEGFREGGRCFGSGRVSGD